MSVQIVVHKGFKHVMYENSLVGVLAVILNQKFCEFDILFVENQWTICHDFHAISFYHSNVSELLQILTQYKDKIKNNIIIDVKWDFVKNEMDSMDDAIIQLKQDLKSFEKHPHIWLQASNHHVLKSFLKHELDHFWSLGMIVYNVEQFHHYKDWIRYAMISLTDFPIQDIKTMSMEKDLFGYTCHDPSELYHYKHLFGYVTGIVCDVSV